MKDLIAKAIALGKKYTSGLPFFIWAFGGFAVFLFIVIFHDHQDFHLEKLKYIIAVAVVWFVASDVLKKLQTFNPHVHFVFDSIFYLVTLSSTVYYTGGLNSDLYFIFFFGAISAPLFGTTLEMFLFIVALSIASIWFHASTSDYRMYHLGLVILESVFYFVIAGVIKATLIRVSKAEEEKRSILQKTATELESKIKERTAELSSAKKQLESSNESLQKKVKERTFELEESKKNLEKSVEERTAELKQKFQEIEEINRLLIGRELRMAELKQEIHRLKMESRQNKKEL